MRKTPSSILGMAVLGLAGLTLTACDRGHHKREHVAKAECCCDKTCPTPAPSNSADGAAAQTTTPTTTPPDAPAVVTTSTAGYGAKATSGGRRDGRTTAHAKSYRYASGASRGYGRTGTEGVGYLDEAGDGSSSAAYRRAEVSIEDRTTYSERRTSSQSGYAYGGAAYGSQGGYASEGYATGGEYRTESRYSSGQGGQQGGRYRRKRDRSYVGTDRYGYLTWPGKTR
jgi:hypothetical protein